MLHHVVYQGPLAPLFAEAARLLRPGGALVAVEPGLWHPVGAGLEVANRFGLGPAVHGTPDDIPISPRVLVQHARVAGLEPELHAVTFGWRRLPASAQRAAPRAGPGGLATASGALRAHAHADRAQAGIAGNARLMSPSRYDDELWELVPDEPGPPPETLRGFVRSLGHAERVLDLGCGDGRLTAELDAGELTAADVSPVALERARRRLPDARIVELEPDAVLPFDDGSFELVLCAETIEHVRDVQLLLSEIRRVLRPGGTLALTTPATLPFGRPPGPTLAAPALFHAALAAAAVRRAGVRGRVAPARLGHAARARYSLSPGWAVPDFSRRRARASTNSWRPGTECGFR